MEYKMDSIRFTASQAVAPNDEKLQLDIDVSIDGFAIFIETISGSTKHVFVIPQNVRDCALDLGTGTWTTRIGVMVGDPIHGTVTWSSFTEPVAIKSKKRRLAEQPTTIELTKLLQIEEGVRLYTTMPKFVYCLAEVWKVGEPREKALWYYYYNTESPCVDIKHLQYTNQYNICIRIVDKFPQTEVCHLRKGYMIERRTAVAPNRYLDATEKASRLSGQVIINQPNIKFKSHTDYLRYQAALARSNLK